MDELKSKCAIFDKFTNEAVSYLHMFCSRMLNRIFRDVNNTCIVAINGKMFLTNTIIKKVAFTDVGCNSYQQRCVQPQ